VTKSDLVATLAVQKGLPLTVADRTIDEIFKCMSKSLIANDRIEIRGFGSIQNRRYNSYSGRNPSTGKAVTVKPKVSPFFKVGKELKERLIFSKDVVH
jgi:integration host factor subunit beta